MRDDSTVVVPSSAPRSGSVLLSKIGHFGLKTLGWGFTGEFADVKKMIVIVAPHTSNWDWVLGIFFKWAISVRFSYFIKRSLFFWPFSLVLRGTGGIPVNRDNPQGLLDDTAIYFQEMDKLYLAIAPEGTRKAVTRWKTGFLRIAYATGVPVVPIALDHQTRQIIVCPPLPLSGDMEQDLDSAKHVFRAYTP